MRALACGESPFSYSGDMDLFILTPGGRAAVEANTTGEPQACGLTGGAITRSPQRGSGSTETMEA